MINRNFNPGFQIELHQKDLDLALSGARALGLSLPNTATCQELFSSCATHGESLGRLGHAPCAGDRRQLRDRSETGIMRNPNQQGPTSISTRSKKAWLKERAFPS
jgi:hypothetical protein